MVALNPQSFLFLVTLVCCFYKPICPCTWATNQILLLTVLPDTFLLLPCLHSNVLIAIGQSDLYKKKNFFFKGLILIIHSVNCLILVVSGVVFKID